jgi:hypothetical protein
MVSVPNALLHMILRGPNTMQSTFKHFPIKFWKLPLALLLAFSSQFSLAQLDRGTIQVIVSDNTGAVVTNALVVVTDTDTARKYQHHGAPDGQYSFPYLPAGQYQLDVSASGFNSATLTGVVLNANDTTSQRVTLTVGTATQSVSVSGSEVGMNLGNGRARGRDLEPAGQATASQWA